MPLERFNPNSRLPSDRVEHSIKIGILAIAAIAFVWTIARLPGMDWLAPDGAVHTRGFVRLVIGGALTTGLVGVAGQVNHMVIAGLDGPAQLVEHVAAVCRWSLLLIAVLLTHWAGGPEVNAFVPALRPIDDLLFLGLSIALLIIAGRVWVAADPAAAYLTGTK